ncbi:MAG: Fe-S cluster assembly ATPase SufC [bacterium]
MLTIKNLKAKVETDEGGIEILKGVNLLVNAGEVHAIMGPNGSGKSTLASVITGREGYEVESGEVLFEEKNLLELSPEERARLGIFLAFQYPVEIPGVSNTNFLKTAVNEIRKSKGEEPMSSVEFLKMIKEKAKLVDIEPEMLSRYVNVGFSGGEKKRNEIFQLAMLNPRLSILDETDSGLDIDALRIVAKGVNTLKTKENAFIVITHYQRLLDYIVPDFVHVMFDGRIVKSGGKELALKLEEQGYDWVNELNEEVTV